MQFRSREHLACHLFDRASTPGMTHRQKVALVLLSVEKAIELTTPGGA